MNISPITQAVTWWCFVPRLMTPEQFVRAAADAGYDAIEQAPREYWQLIKDHGLALSAVPGHASLSLGLNRVDQHARIERELIANLAEAKQWGLPALIVFSGNRDGLDDTHGAENTAAGLKRAARAAEDAGVSLVLELLNSKVDHGDYQCDRTDWGVRVIEAVGSPHVKLLYDIYHMQIMEGDIIRTIQASHAAFGYYHTAGNPGRHEIDGSQELHYPPIIKAIAATGYHGVIAHEFVPAGDPIASMRHAHALTAAALADG